MLCINLASVCRGGRNKTPPLRQALPVVYNTMSTLLWEKFVDVFAVYKSGKKNHFILEEKTQAVISYSGSVSCFMTLKFFCVRNLT